jgi:hypothetical protein
MSDVYYPPEIKDQAIGNQTETVGNDTTNKTYDTEVYSPVSPVNRDTPKIVISHETVSQSLDTRTKKIRGEYSFSKEGAIVIGGYVNGVSGEIAISPDGLVAKNVNGEDTIAIDGTTGNATFKGTVQAGSLIAGLVNVGSPAVVIDGGNGRIVVNDGTNNRIVIGSL